ncbi:helix-turn-helix domain-containing protein [Nocardia iowensis]|uniref:Helix-turn-helix transcriptional regulator n=1 Tax=Nocardia iowensis TaxID=204891 RepID=A0ABX8RFZ9_NOCIO|nr:helix-turn-helix transcriptional regulator [Nocardia iowensis]QXN88533.1 helix-turn-helix transcriptional regulator [Nocardia iowensis]
MRDDQDPKIKRGRPRAPVRARCQEHNELAEFLRQRMDTARVRQTDLVRSGRRRAAVSDKLRGLGLDWTFITDVLTACTTDPSRLRSDLQLAHQLWQRGLTNPTPPFPIDNQPRQARDAYQAALQHRRDADGEVIEVQRELLVKHKQLESAQAAAREADAARRMAGDIVVLLTTVVLMLAEEIQQLTHAPPKNHRGSTPATGGSLDWAINRHDLAVDQLADSQHQHQRAIRTLAAATVRVRQLRNMLHTYASHGPPEHTALDNSALAIAEPLSLDNIDRVLHVITSTRQTMIDNLDHAVIDLYDATTTTIAPGRPAPQSRRAGLPDPSGSYALLPMKTSAIGQVGLHRMHSYLTLAGILPISHVLTGRRDQFSQQLAWAASRATDALIFIYQGGAVLTDDDQIHLMDTPGSYRTIQQSITESRAARKLVVLDIASRSEIPADRFAVPGAVVAVCIRARGHLGFLSVLDDILLFGIRQGPELIDIATIFDHLLAEPDLYPAASRPRIFGEIGGRPLALGRNQPPFGGLDHPLADNELIAENEAEFADLLRRIHDRSAVPLPAVAAITGISLQTLDEYLRGRSISRDDLQRICRACGVDPGQTGRIAALHKEVYDGWRLTYQTRHRSTGGSR